MATPNTHEILDRWTEVTAAGGDSYHAEGRRLTANGRTLEATWEIRGSVAEYLPAGRHRERPLYLVTGDTWAPPPFQRSLQWEIRTAVQRRARDCGADVLVVPFSALDSAGIVRSSIRLLEGRPDETWEETQECDEFRHVPIRERTLTRTEDRESARLEDMPTDKRKRYQQTDEGWRFAEVPPDADGTYRWTVSVKYNRPRDSDGKYRWTVSRHRLGDAVFTAAVRENVRRRRPWTVRDVVRAAGECVSEESFERRQNRLGVEPGPRLASDRLEDVDVSAPIVETVQRVRRRRFISSFDMNEGWGGLYFLATLPASSRARTVEMAIEDLAPAAVHAAMARGRDVRRQGDIFFVETSLSDADVAAVSTARARFTQWDRASPARPGEVGKIPRISAYRWRRIRNEQRRLWHSGVSEDCGYGTAALDSWNECGRIAFERFSGRPPAGTFHERIRECLAIHGTAHTGTEVVRAPGGRIYVRGIVRHVPAIEPGGSRWRDRDHVNLRLGDGRTWYLAIRNTVPRSRDTGGR